MDFFTKGFGIFGILFLLLFLLVFGVILYVIITMARQSRRNDRSPRLTVAAAVVAKRSQMRVHSHGDEMMHHHSTTTYYVTFQVDSGDRMELCVPGEEYGLLVEGDRGELTFQGSRFLRFDREWQA